MLLKWAFNLVNSVVGSLAQQLNIVENQALNPMRAIVQQVVGGVWIGEGANAFVEEVSSLMIPGVGQVGQHITMVSTNLQRASNIMEQADQDVLQAANGLGDLFGSIYGG